MRTNLNHIIAVGLEGHRGLIPSHDCFYDSPPPTLAIFFNGRVMAAQHEEVCVIEESIFQYFVVW